MDLDRLIGDSSNSSITVREVLLRFDAVKELLWPILDELAVALREED
jgi:hypothetical protein